ncbi:MAG: SCO family protein [Pseudomonadota bacterium]
MRIGLVITMTAAFALGSLAAFALLPGGHAYLKGFATQQGRALIGGPFELVRHDGKPVTHKTYEGKHLLVYFGFTHCPDICPAGLQVITAALEKLGPKAKDVKPVFVSVDPQRDTPDAMKDYVSSFHPSLDGLTGSKAQVAAMARTYRVYYNITPNPEHPEDYTVDHSGFMYLMAPDGRYVAHFSHHVAPAKLAERLAALL